MAERRVVAVVGLDSLPTCWAIRRTVFIEGQSVPESVEVDGRDSECVHVLGEVDGKPVATARLRMIDGGAKVERVAVLDAFRGRGLGRDVMAVIEREAAARGAVTLKLNAQRDVVQFYLDLGYEPVGDEFIEANIVHQAMVKRT